MNRNKIIFAVALALIVLIATAATASAQQKRVLFYEKKSDYTIEKEYSIFKEALERKGYVVESLNIELSSEVLQNRDPDVLVIASLKQSLSSSELATIFEFVMQKGGGLFVLGGAGRRGAANQITIPFGMTLDSAVLQDERNPVIEGSKQMDNEKNFVVSNFNRDDSTVRMAINGISDVAFFEGPGIIVPKQNQENSVKVIAKSSRTAYSPASQIFEKGSQPPIAAATIVGNGLVFVLTDEDMLTDEHLDTDKYRYDNLRFGTNIVDWLYSIELTSNTSQNLEELNVVYGECKLEKQQLQQNLSNTSQQLNSMIQQNQNLMNKISNLNAQIDEYEAQTDPYLGMKYMYWAIAIVGLGILVLSIVVAGRRSKEEPEVSETEGDVFGYEFEEAFQDEDEEEDIDLSEVEEEINKKKEE